MDSPVSLNYEWPKMVTDWRENHKHGHLFPGSIGSAFDPGNFTPENMSNFEELRGNNDN